MSQPAGDIAKRFGEFSTYDVSPTRALELFEEARGECPVAHSEQLGGFHALLDYEDVKAAAFDWRRFSSEPSFLRPVIPHPPVPPIEFDPPVHTGWREIFAQALNPRTVERIEPVVRADVRRQLDGVASSGKCDLVTALSAPIPPFALAHILGLDPDGLDDLVSLTTVLLANFGDPDKGMAAYEALLAFGTREIEKRREHPTDDFITLLAEAELDGRPLTPDEVSRGLIAFLSAGHETTVSGISSLLCDVVAHPEIRDRLVEDPSAIPVVIEESLRLHTPFFGFFRRATEDVSIRGAEIPAEGDVYLCWAAANRDPSVFEDPAEFRPDRPRRRHMSFGFGVHSCAGAAVARMELRVVLQGLLTRLPDVELEPEADGAYSFAGAEAARIDTLPVRFTPVS